MFWRSNKKSWVRNVIFCDWFPNYYVPEVETNLDFKSVLVLDNDPGHPREFEALHPNIKVIFLVPNTAALLQPMDHPGL